MQDDKKIMARVMSVQLIQGCADKYENKLMWNIYDMDTFYRSTQQASKNLTNIKKKIDTKRKKIPEKDS